MSLALFHERQTSQQSVNAVVCGSFTEPGVPEFITLSDRRIVLHRAVTDEMSGQRLRFITDCTLFARIDGIAVSRGDQVDLLVVLSRHSMISVLQYDSATNGFKTVGQTCYDVESSSLAFRSPFFRVLGQFVVVQFSPDALTFISLESALFFSVPIKLGGPLKLASIDDVQFVSSISSTALIVAVLGKSVSHAWIGRTSTIGPLCSVVGVFSVDFGEKKILLNWSFDSLPTEAFSLVALPLPRSGLLVLASESVSYLEDFGSSKTMPFSGSLDGSVACCITDDLVLFASVEGPLHLAHLVRQPGTFATVTDIVWAHDVAQTKMRPTCMCFHSDLVFVGSRFSSSFLFRTSKTEILLPIMLFAATEEAKLDAYVGEELASLIDMYRDETHRVKISSSVELGLVDELEMWGQITSLSEGAIATTSSGERLGLHAEVPADLVVELPGMKGFSEGVCNFGLIPEDSLVAQSFLVLFGEAGVLLINATVGLKECYRLKTPEPVLTVMTTSSKILLVTKQTLLGVPLVSTKTTNCKYELIHTFSTSAERIACGNDWIARIENGTSVAVYDSKGQVVFQIDDNLVELLSIHVAADFITLADAHGTVSIYRQSVLVFRSLFASLAPPILTGEMSEVHACLSITDPASRPTEVDPSVALFAKSVSILSARYEDGLLILLVEGRPLLVYQSWGNTVGPFRLLALDQPYLVSPDAPKTHLTDICAVNPQTSLLLTRTDRGEVWAHAFRDKDAKTICRISSEFAKNGGFASVSKSGNLRIFAIPENVQIEGGTIVSDRAQTGGTGVLSAWSPVGGLAVAVAEPEEDTTEEMVDETIERFGKRQRFTVRIFGANEEQVIPLHPFEMVTDVTWASSVLGLGPDVLAIGTTFAMGEELPAQGRILLMRGPILLFDSQKGAAVTVLKDWKGCLVAGLGHRFMFYQWDATAGRLRGCAMYDMALQITSVAFARSFMIAGDILRGTHLLRYKEDPVIDFQTGLATSMAASISFLAKSPPVHEAHTVLNVGTIRLGNTVGFVSIDKFHNLDLHVFSPLHYGQYLRPSVPFALGFATTALLATPFDGVSSSLLIGSAAGTLAQLVPVSETDHHLASSLSGLMVALLPHMGGLNPRLKHVPLASNGIRQIGAVQGVEAVDHLLNFLYLSTPLQAEIAGRIKLPIETLTQSVASWLAPK